jgi:hypothetical protein
MCWVEQQPQDWIHRQIASCLHNWVGERLLTRAALGSPPKPGPFSEEGHPGGLPAARLACVQSSAPALTNWVRKQSTLGPQLYNL